MERKELLINGPGLGLQLLPFFLYAETHYRFRFLFSYLKKSEPELIADVPHRLDPGKPLPLLFLAKDADSYPCTVKSLTVEIRKAETAIVSKQLLSSPVNLRSAFWWKVFCIKLPKVQGWVECDITMEIEVNGETRTYKNDNHRTSTQKPFRVFVADEPLPRLRHLHLGEGHSHSLHTSDQVEFGPPITATQELARQMGLSFFCVTDHSYDLDDRVDNYLENDPDLPKWKAFHKEVDTANSQHAGPVVIRGEEVSCRNTLDRNVHLLLFGTRQFFHGTGDSADRWLRTRSEHSAKEILKEKEEHVVAFAAHARENVPFLQRILLGRGRWEKEDLASEGLRGFQFANGKNDEGFADGYRMWIQLLLEGKRAITLGGNDAHGSFNRFRQVGIPFFKVTERDEQIFGQMRTGVFARQSTESSYLQALAKGRCIVTDGPVANIRTSGSDLTCIGAEIRSRHRAFTLEAGTTEEFGEFQSVRIMQGVIGATGEEELFSGKVSGLSSYKIPFKLQISKPSYIRAEILTSPARSSDRRPHFCFTNPVWLIPV